MLVSALHARAQLVGGARRPLVPLRSAPIIAKNGAPIDPHTSCLLKANEFCVMAVAIPFRAEEATREPHALEMIECVQVVGTRADGVGESMHLRIHSYGSKHVSKNYMYMPGGFIGFKPAM